MTDLIGWVVYGSSEEVQEVELQLDCLLLPDDYIVRFIGLLESLTAL